MVKDPFKKWDRVETFCALLVDLGIHAIWFTKISCLRLLYINLDLEMTNSSCLHSVNSLGLHRICHTGSHGMRRVPQKIIFVV